MRQLAGFCGHLICVVFYETEDATSYSVQFHVKNPETLEYWMQSEGRDLQQELVNRFGAKLVGFSTLLEEIDLES